MTGREAEFLSLFLLPNKSEFEGAVADVNVNQTSAAFEIIASAMSSQQQKSVPVQKDFFSETELKGENTDQNADSNDDQSSSESGNDRRANSMRQVLQKALKEFKLMQINY